MDEQEAHPGGTNIRRSMRAEEDKRKKIASMEFGGRRSDAASKQI